MDADLYRIIRVTPLAQVLALAASLSVPVKTVPADWRHIPSEVPTAPPAKS